MASTWIEPLEFETIFYKLVAEGSGAVFGIISLMVIAGMCAYFRMNGLIMFFLIGVFILLFAEWIGSSLLILLAIVGGLLIGYTISKIVKG